MSSSVNFKNYILEQLRNINKIKCKPMMGEYLLYYDDVLFGGLYDDRFLIKITELNEKYKLTKQIPYNNAKPMYYVKDLDNVEYLQNLVLDTYKSLKK